MLMIGIDVGGSGIKTAIVETTTGEFTTSRIRVETPQPATPKAVAKAAAGIVADMPGELSAGIGFPAVVLKGEVRTAANVDHGWIGTQADTLFANALGRSLIVGNDADAAGLAEMRFGAGRGEMGTVLMLTLGTGIGSALFRDGVLIPNTELGHLQVRGKDAEHRAAASVKERKGLSWQAWAKLLSEYLDAIDALLWPDLVIIGGGISKEADHFIKDLPTRVRCVPATLLNRAGIVGAAMLAAEAATLTAPQASAGVA
ncbi:MAG: polyphosphate glucokinase [Gaiellales bacterium]|jgi:polyphosphate glucokinase|nr:polyphosphate glucokinase [Gaiellales bacterium]